MASRSMAAMEVPIVGSDAVRWIEVTVPSSTSSSPAVPSEARAPLTENASSCHLIPGDPPTYLIWRIHKNLPHVLELVEVSALKEFPKSGLRLVFQDALCPFGLICKNEIQSPGESPYLLYVLTVSGVVYLLKLKNVCAYTSGSVSSQNEFVEFAVQGDSHTGRITAVAGIFGCLVIGRQDGSIVCLQLGVLDPSMPGFIHELRDDLGINRIWSLMARGKIIGAVIDLVMLELHGTKFLLVLHEDFCLRVWDLSTHVKVLNHNINLQQSAGACPLRLWADVVDWDKCLITLAILCGGALETNSEIVIVYGLHFNAGDKVLFSPDASIQSLIPLDEGRVVDLKITSNKLWILREDGPMSFDLSETSFNLEHSCSYGLHEASIAEILFQGTECAFEDLIWMDSSMFSSVKDQVVLSLSMIFLRRLLQPGVYQTDALRETILDYDKHLTDSEFQSLTVAGLKKELLSIIESVGSFVSPISTLNFWKTFCTCYYHCWCQNNIPYGLLVDSSTGAIGLIRKSSISLFRCLEDVELLAYGSSEDFHDLGTMSLTFPRDGLDFEILLDVLRCSSSISHQLGRSATAIFYESLITPDIMSEDITSRLLKIIETGHGSTVEAKLSFHFGADTAWEKQKADHKVLRKFSVDMLISLHALCSKAMSWSRVLDVVEKYLKHLIPHKITEIMEAEASFDINSFLLVNATSQVARVMFESSFDIYMFLGYLVNVGGQILMMEDHIFRIKHQLIPMIQDILMQWFTVHFIGTTLSESPTLEDFSSQLSSLHIDNKNGKLSLEKKLGTYGFSLACMLNFPKSPDDVGLLASSLLPPPSKFISLLRSFISWIIWGGTVENSSVSISPTIELASTLLNHGQYKSAEDLLASIYAHSRRRKLPNSKQSFDGEWCAHLHLLGFCLLMRAQNELHGVFKEKAVRESVCYFFSAASGQKACQSLQKLFFQTGLQHPVETASVTTWKLHYYQWAMQVFEQYSLSEGACQFALAALEQVDESVIGPEASVIRGRLWANVFKFSLDLNNYRDAYCAIISNPDEDSKTICLRRFINVLCEQGATKIMCDGELPFIGLIEKVEQELVWKAERSDVSAKPNPYKLLYAFEMHRNNWRKAAGYMYQYYTRLRKETNIKELQQPYSEFQERLESLSAAINALQLVHPAYAWIESQHEDYFSIDQHSPKRSRKFVEEDNTLQAHRLQYCIDIEMMEEDYVLTSAQFHLLMTNEKVPFMSCQSLSNLVDMLIQANLYDMAFTVAIKFLRGSSLKSELERVFIIISEKCSSSRKAPSDMWNDGHMHTPLLTYSEDETIGHTDVINSVQHFKGDHWELLELYLEKYKKLHSRLPVIVAETLLHSDPQLELPLWLVHMFKGGRRVPSWGMAGQESDPATLFRLYVNYGRYTEATNLLLEYIDSLASLRPADIINRKKMSAIWFPYTAIERLWCQLDQLRSSNHMVDQCDKLKKLLQDALLKHLKQIKVDSDDAVSAAHGA
ncbi:hypothetical protein QJS10_CPB11g01906 [Acorus calamus]|uniref:Nuclear pore complex protein NUP160 domain-containing protein n=1 Tax=Acorus calamus TaxID=4465 RepID=A0AAV9DS58_ACOCL|nr:hypothetical protein QJS10_CPB11g01906 [Acorus calamus]